jgi:hypothetical protein
MAPVINKTGEVKLVVPPSIFRYGFYLHVESNRIGVAGSHFSILFSPDCVTVLECVHIVPHVTSMLANTGIT